MRGGCEALPARPITTGRRAVSAAVQQVNTGSRRNSRAASAACRRRRRARGVRRRGEAGIPRRVRRYRRRAARSSPPRRCGSGTTPGEPQAEAVRQGRAGWPCGLESIASCGRSANSSQPPDGDEVPHALSAAPPATPALPRPFRSRARQRRRQNNRPHPLRFLSGKFRIISVCPRQGASKRGGVTGIPPSGPLPAIADPSPPGEAARSPSVHQSSPCRDRRGQEVRIGREPEFVHPHVASVRHLRGRGNFRRLFYSYRVLPGDAW